MARSKQGVPYDMTRGASGAWSKAETSAPRLSAPDFFGGWRHHTILSMRKIES
jgi:hypothetical protein